MIRALIRVLINNLLVLQKLTSYVSWSNAYNIIIIHNFNIELSKIFNINQNIVNIYYNKNVKFFCKDLVNKVLETGISIKKLTKHNLIFKVLILDLKVFFYFFFEILI